MTKSVVLTLSTKDSVFPSGTVDSSYVFTITDAAGIATTQEVTDPHATFDGVAPGDYTASVTKNGGVASATFSVPADTVTLSVPDVLTVALS